MRTLLLSALVLLCGTGAALSQEYRRNIAEQRNIWISYFGTHRVHESWSIHTELQLRRSDYLEHWQQLLLRGGLNYHISPAFFVSAGYGFIDTWPYGEQPVPVRRPEHRLWQQVNLQHTIGFLDMQHRYRLEQRFLRNFARGASGINELQDGYEYQNRVRYRAMATIPFSGGKITQGDFFGIVADEIFVNFGESIRANIFDQNRLNFLVGYQFAGSGNIQLGYLNQILQKADGIRFENNHTFMLNLVYNTDWR